MLQYEDVGMLLKYRHSPTVVCKLWKLLGEEPALWVEVILLRKQISHDVQGSRQVYLTSYFYHSCVERLLFRKVAS